MAEVSDVLRVICTILYAITMAMALWISLSYYDKYKRSTDWRGLLPHHVYIIGGSYILYATASIGYSFTRFGEILSPFGVMNLLGGISGIYALRLVMRYEDKDKKHINDRSGQ